MSDSTRDALAAAVAYLHDRFEERGIWHCLTYGTLLGAVRDGDVIPWDYDFDLFIRPTDVDRIMAMNADVEAEGYWFKRMWIYGSLLAVNPSGLGSTPGCALGVFHRGAKVGDLYAYNLFSDGILRRYDPSHEVYWLPHSSLPHFFVEQLNSAPLRGRRYPVPQHAEKFLAGCYGEDWHVPYRAVRQGGELREGVTSYGDRFAPKLADEIAYAEAHGWDRTKYQHELPWPRPMRAAGPVGEDPRTAGTSHAWWWRTRDELLAHY